MTALSIAVLTAIACYLWWNVEWLKATCAKSLGKDLVMDFSVYMLHSSLLKRSVGLFAGFALIFVGCAMALYTVREATKLNLTGAGFKAVLASNSPGIVAMLLGVYLMVSTMNSKDEFPALERQGATEQVTDDLKVPN